MVRRKRLPWDWTRIVTSWGRDPRAWDFIPGSSMDSPGTAKHTPTLIAPGRSAVYPSLSLTPLWGLWPSRRARCQRTLRLPSTCESRAACDTTNERYPVTGCVRGVTPSTGRRFPWRGPSAPSARTLWVDEGAAGDNSWTIAPKYFSGRVSVRPKMRKLPRSIPRGRRPSGT